MRFIYNQNNGSVMLHTVIANTLVVCSNTADSGNLVYSEIAAEGEYANIIKGCVIFHNDYKLMVTNNYITLDIPVLSIWT